jgi:hypothetical protein
LGEDEREEGQAPVEMNQQFQEREVREVFLGGMEGGSRTIWFMGKDHGVMG